MASQLEELQRQIWLNNVPVITVLVLLGIVGILGNAITIFFYGFKTKRQSSTIVFITYLAAFDLGASLLIVWTVVDLLGSIRHRDKTVCMVMYYSMKVFVYSSLLVLWIISIDRYLKICRPHGKQFSKLSAKISVLIIFIAALIISSKTFVAWGVVIREIPFANMTFNVSDCSCEESEDKKTAVTVFHLFDLSAAIIVVTTFAFTYGNIRLKLKEQNVTMKKSWFQVEFKKTGTAAVYNVRHCTIDGNHEIFDDAAKGSQSSLGSGFTSTNNLERPAPAPTPTPTVTFKLGRKKSDSVDRNVTMMMFAVSVGFCACLLPYITWNMAIVLYPKAKLYALHPGIQFVMRTCFINAVINPILFCIFNPEYRKFVKNAISKTKGIKKNKAAM